MKMQANQVKVGMKISFGWGELLTIKEIKKDYQKNGKELTIFIGNSTQEIIKSKSRKYPIIENRENVDLTFKSETQIIVK
jgi:translation elongation factor P/translation initiation factor 5A